MAEEEATRLADDAAIARTVQALKERNVEAVVVGNREEALRKLVEMIPEGSEVRVSSSETLDTIGYTKYVEEGNHYRSVLARVQAVEDLKERRELMRTIGTSPEYIVGSVQAIAETGEVVVASASGSQLGAHIFGAKNVIWAAGTQKIVPTLEAAVARTRGYTLWRHDQWSLARGEGTPPIGKLTLFEKEVLPGRIKIVLVKERLGW